MNDEEYIVDNNFLTSCERAMLSLRDGTESPAQRMIELFAVTEFYKRMLRRNYGDDHPYNNLIDYFYGKVMKRCCRQLCGYRK